MRYIERGLTEDREQVRPQTVAALLESVLDTLAGRGTPTFGAEKG